MTCFKAGFALTSHTACGILPSMTTTMPTTRDYLTELLTTYWFAPPVALWRAVELRVAAEERYERPLLDLGLVVTQRHATAKVQQLVNLLRLFS